MTMAITSINETEFRFPNNLEPRYSGDWGSVVIGAKILQNKLTTTEAIKQGTWESSDLSKLHFDHLTIDNIPALGNIEPSSDNHYVARFVRDYKFFYIDLKSTEKITQSNPQKQIFDNMINSFKLLK